jgi:putative hydrolase of the HAD superfamily
MVELNMKAAIFDLGQTLIEYYDDWEGPEAQAIGRLYKAFAGAGADAEEQEFFNYVQGLLETGRKKKVQDMVEIPLEKVLESVLVRYGLDEEEELLKEGCEIFYGVLLERRKLIPGAYEALERIRDRGYNVGLISDVAWGLPSEYPMRDLCHFKLDTLFDDLVFSTDVGLRKPHPRMFKLALYNLGADANESFYVGNSLRADIKGALGVGMRAILKESNHPEHVDGVEPTGKICDWCEIDQYID